MAGISAREIKNRIRSMESTRQITKAMEMVAVSKLRRAQTQSRNSRPYFEILASTIDGIVAANRDFSSPYLNHRGGEKTAYVVIAGDRGLAGGYNSSVLKLAWADMEGRDTLVVPIGRKAADFFKARKTPVFTMPHAGAEEMSMGDCFSVAGQLCKAYRDGQFDVLHLVYTDFVSALSQVPIQRQMLPLVGEHGGENRDVRQEILCEPDSAAVFDAIVPEYLGGMIWGALCQSRAAEQAARRRAMDSATQNAEDMIADLRVKFNRARQSAITQEITEIVAGSGGQCPPGTHEKRS